MYRLWGYPTRPETWENLEDIRNSRSHFRPIEDKCCNTHDSSSYGYQTGTAARIDTSLLIPKTDVVINVTRTGKAVTLINLSFTGSETVFRVFNELFLLMCIPSLDSFFRNQTTGKLKEMMGFIVDNGPSEAQNNFSVQMLIVRLVKFLDLSGQGNSKVICRIFK